MPSLSEYVDDQDILAWVKGFKMIGSLITRGLLLIFGYAYPAYECFKTVEMNKPEIEQLRFWCQYWILVAVLTVCERIGDMFIGWVPMYAEAKVAFFIYLWFPKTKGTTYVYDSFFRPYVAQHETEIDRNLLELRTRAGDMAVLYWQKVANYGQTRIFEILQYIASQSTPARPAQPQQQGSRVQNTSVPPNRRSAATTQPQDGQPSSPASSTSSSEQEEDATEAAGPSEDPKAAAAPASLNEQKITPTPSLVQSSKTSSSSEVQVMQIDSVPSTATENPQPPPPDLTLEDAVRVVTRARSRRTRAALGR
ncbi:HVA22-like protein i [Sesamum angolense]|uniref:HVA22-like protein n=1 Tax=Sesamum angolense TaxID=2727404 RepID=A0AAE1WCP0_9LAMI|nr:HVA22-like protein i [Sesamum angolense]